MRTRIGMVLIVVLMVGLLAGCNGVMLNSTYSELLDQTAAWSKAASDRAQAGTMDANSMKTSLDTNAQLWHKFQAARDGRAD